MHHSPFSVAYQDERDGYLLLLARTEYDYFPCGDEAMHADLVPEARYAELELDPPLLLGPEKLFFLSRLSAANHWMHQESNPEDGRGFGMDLIRTVSGGHDSPDGIRMTVA